MALVPCPQCGGDCQETDQGLLATLGESAGSVQCSVCQGHGRVSETWLAVYRTTAFRTRCLICGNRRPCAVMADGSGKIVFVCAECARTRPALRAIRDQKEDPCRSGRHGRSAGHAQS